MNNETIAIHESAHSEKVVKFIELSIESLTKHCSKQYAERIMFSQNNGYLYGVHLTKSGRYKASFK